MKSKGCLNPECEVFQKKQLLSDSDNFCPKCGTPLETVCQNKNCYKPIGESEKYCKIHEAERADRRDKALEILGKVEETVVGVVITAVATVLTKGKINIPFKKE